MRGRVRVCVQGGSTLCVCVRVPARRRMHARTRPQGPPRAPRTRTGAPCCCGRAWAEPTRTRCCTRRWRRAWARRASRRTAQRSPRAARGRASARLCGTRRRHRPPATLPRRWAATRCVRARACVRSPCSPLSALARARALDAVCARARECARVRVCVCGRASRLTRARAGRAGGRAARGTRAHRCTAAAAAAAAHTTTSAARTRASIRATLIPSVFQRCFVSAPSCACARSRRRGGACAGGRARSGARPERVPRAPTVLTSRRGLRSPSSPLPSLAPSRACLRS